MYLISEASNYKCCKQVITTCILLSCYHVHIGYTSELGEDNIMERNQLWDAPLLK